MPGDDRGGGALAAAREAARALGAEGLSDPERAWLETTTRDLRRLVPGEAAGARDSLSIDAGDDDDDDDDVDVAFVEAVVPHRPKQNVPSTASIETSALPPLPALPIGSRLLPIGELVSWRSRRGAKGCASDLRALWSGARAAARAAEARECQKENQNEETFAAAAKGGAVPTLTRANIETVQMAIARENALAPVVPFAVVGRLRLARAAKAPNDETKTEQERDEDEDDSFGTGLFLEDATGRVAVASVDLPDARILGKRVLCVAWTLVIEEFASKKTTLLEVNRFIALDAPSVVADPLPAMANFAVPAPPPPRRGAGFEVRGAVTAVSPMVTLRVPREDGEETIRHRFFLVELGDACASCGGNDGGDDRESRDPSDLTDRSWRRRLVFTGDALARWRPFFGGATEGDQGAGASCGCVLISNLRASRLFKGEGDRRELRVAAATATTTVTPVSVVRDKQSSILDVDTDRVMIASNTGGCACLSCTNGDTVSFLDAYVVGEDPSGLGVRISGVRDGRGVPFLLTHAFVGSPPRDGVAFPALRSGTLVRVTHAHPVWRRREETASGVGDDDEAYDDDSDSDSDSDDDDSAEPPIPERRRTEDETDHFGCRALGACVRTRVRLLRRSPLASKPPRLFAADSFRSRPKLADEARNSGSRRFRRLASLLSARAMQRHCETRSFVETARLRRLLIALARRIRADDRNDRNARAALASLVLGKRKRAGGDDAEAEEGDERFRDALAAAFSRDSEPETSHEASNSGFESARASIYHEFFAPIGLGGCEARLPKLPAVSAVLNEAKSAFAEASAAKTKTQNETKDSKRIPFGASVGAARCDRLVLPGEALFAKKQKRPMNTEPEGGLNPTKPVALVGWLARRARDGGARDALELSDVPIYNPSPDAVSGNAARHRRLPSDRVHVEIEDASVLVPETLPLGGLVVLKRWSVFCEGASLCVADDPEPLKSAPCRVHVRVRREDLTLVGAVREGGVLGERRLAPPPTPKCGVSDVLVWRPDRVCSFDGDSKPDTLSGPGGVPLSLFSSRAKSASTEVRERFPLQKKWPPAPWFPPPFLARVTRDERVLDDRGGERKLRLTLADTINEYDVVDAYVGNMDPKRIPLGIGAGAIVLVERAAAHVSASANIYLKLTSQTVLRVVSPAQSTLLGGSKLVTCLPRSLSSVRVKPSTCEKRFATLDALAKGAKAGFDFFCVDRRKWTTRARVARVSFLCAKWACLSCGCDAGSFGAAHALAAMRLVAERRAERERNLREGHGEFTANAEHLPRPPSAVAGCSMCRPPAERFRDDAALARAVDAACGFEVELGVVLTDGEASTDCWVAGDAGKNMLPPAVRAATRALAKKHGRVVARFDAAAANDFRASNPYVMEGYCGRALGETESGPLLAALGHAASLGEVLATVEYKYVAFPSSEQNGNGNERSFGGFGALSAPGPTTRVMSLGGVPVTTNVAPTAKLRATALEPVEPAREAARMLAEEATKEPKACR